ncbi:MAG: SMC-Scp complex subunit ScpB, partial [Planctomycetes bacterium]|nr:SMC-Scp complex subunit ScpB [Planctomycetota bacterium]
MIQRQEAEPANDPVSALEPQLEALLFVASEPLPLPRLAEIVGAEAALVREALGRLMQAYSGRAKGVHLVEIAGGWRMFTNPECADAVAALKARKEKDRLSAAALETLAIIAYKQPVSRAEIERIRGVGAGPVLRHLMELDLVRVAGREEELGRALLYGTTQSFLDRF